MTNALNYMVELKPTEGTIHVYFNTESSFYNEKNMRELIEKYVKNFKNFNIIAKEINDGKEIMRI